MGSALWVDGASVPIANIASTYPDSVKLPIRAFSTALSKRIGA
jgi:hypothetical protein